MQKSSEKALLQILDNYGFQKIENCDKYNPLGQTWKLAENIGSGYFWSYYHNDMFGIKIHDFSFSSETIIEADMPEGLNIAYYTSISGEELNPYRRLNANCVKSHLNGYKPFKAVIHKNIPVRSIGIEIMPAYYEDYLQRLYPGEYASPYDAFLEVDETTNFPEMRHIKSQGWQGCFSSKAKWPKLFHWCLREKNRPKSWKQSLFHPLI